MAATLVAGDAVRRDRSMEREEALLAGLNDMLHEMSQPMMALLCSLECARGLESVAEMRQMIGFGMESCERLGATVRAMQMRMKQGMNASGGAGA